MRALLLFVVLVFPQIAFAEVFMCIDPVSGKKTFTDRACPTQETGKEVKVEPTNFGGGVKTHSRGGTWTSDADKRVTATETMGGHGRRIEAARSAGDVAQTN